MTSSDRDSLVAEVAEEGIEWAADRRIKEIVVDRREIERRVSEIGRQITEDYAELPLPGLGITDEEEAK